MFTPASPLSVTDFERSQLDRLERSGKTPQRVALRVRIIRMAAEGKPNNAIAKTLAITRPTVLLWRNRFETHRLKGLYKDASRPGRKKTTPDSTIRRIVDATLHTKPIAATHWSVRTMARSQHVSRMTVQRIWHEHNLQPHRVKTFKLSRDKHFVEKLRDVVGLYMSPPDRALVLSVDEKSQIQALDRTQPGLPMKQGRCETMTHDYKRHGTTTLFAALNMLDGTVIGECMPKHRSREFIRFLNIVDRQTPKELDLHLIVDNYSTHKTEAVQKWLRRHKRFHLHFIPTSSSWLNMIERWFGEITRKRIRRGVFRSVEDLTDAIYEYLKAHNNDPKIFTWTKDADTILGKISYCKEALGTAH